MRWLTIAAWLLVPSIASAHDPFFYGYGYRYGHDYGFPYYHSPRTDAELARIRGELRQQRLRSDARERERDAEVGSLRQALSARYQVSAEQACYYRTVGGLEICDDLFEPGSVGLERCAVLVSERNPGC